MTLYKVNNRDPTDFKRCPGVNAWNGNPHMIRGTASNDLIFNGAYSAIWHFNGSSSYCYSSLSGYANLWGISIKNNLYITVGVDYASNKAVIFKGIK